MAYHDPITSPTLILNPEIVLDNLRRMSSKASKLGLKLVPHFKTPQSREIGKWVVDKGIKEITVSSLKQADYLSGLGFDLIHIAFPFNIREIEEFKVLQTSQFLSVQLVNVDSTRFLASTIESNTPFFIEIDAGYGRTGVKCEDYSTIDQILATARESGILSFRGFYIHPGHTYHGDIHKIYTETRDALSRLKSRFGSTYPEMAIRVGDTPGCSIIDDFGPANELGPGNFMFYDLMQVNIGSCSREDIAIALAAPVVDVDRTAGKMLVHGGGVHLSKDFILLDDGSKCFGEVVLLTETGWSIPENRSLVYSISQEHGVINASQELLDSVKIGDLVGILPVHSCMTADCMKKYWSTTGEWIDHAEGA